MTFEAKRLASENISPYMRVAHYNHPTDNQAAIAGNNYFNSAAKALPKGTIIHAVATADGTPALRSYVVTSNNGTTVVVAEASWTHPE